MYLNERMHIWEQNLPTDTFWSPSWVVQQFFNLLTNSFRTNSLTLHQLTIIIFHFFIRLPAASLFGDAMSGVVDEQLKLVLAVALPLAVMNEIVHSLTRLSELVHRRRVPAESRWNRLTVYSCLFPQQEFEVRLMKCSSNIYLNAGNLLLQAPC